MLKHLTLIVELIQQKRKFNCNYGSIISHINNATALIKTCKYVFKFFFI